MHWQKKQAARHAKMDQQKTPIQIEQQILAPSTNRMDRLADQ